MRDTSQNPDMRLIPHRAISLLMIFIMAAFPVLSMMLSSTAAASDYSRYSQHAHQSGAHLQAQMSHDCCKQMSEQTRQRAMSDCCKQQCAHGDQCQCDSVQTGFTLIPTTLTKTLGFPVRSVFQRNIAPLFVANAIDLLFRPPISIL